MTNELILNTVKKGLGGIPEDCNDFDNELIMFINSELARLPILGVGPLNGITITSDSGRWEDLMEPQRIVSSVITYITLKVKMLFDPPANSTITQVINDCIKESEWHLVNKNILGE